MDWPLLVVLFGFSGFGVLLGCAGLIKFVIKYHKDLEYQRKHFAGYTPRKGLCGHLAPLAMVKKLVTLLEFVMWFVWLWVHRFLSAAMVGGPVAWLWGISRLVFLPCFLLHLMVSIMLLVLVEDTPLHLYNPFMAGPILFFLFCAVVDVALYAVSRKPTVLVQMRALAQLLAFALLWDIVCALLMRTGIVLDPLARLQCLELDNVLARRFYHVLRAVFTDFGIAPSCLATDCGEGNAAVRRGRTMGITPLFTSCLLCSQSPREAFRALGSAGILQYHPSANPTGNITANGTQLCSWMNKPRPTCMHPNATRVPNMTLPVSPLIVEGGTVAIPCADVLGCLSCLDAMLSRVPLFFVVHFCVLLVAALACMDAITQLKADSPETADERTLRLQAELQREKEKSEDQVEMAVIELQTSLKREIVVASPSSRKKKEKKPKEPIRAWS